MKKTVLITGGVKGIGRKVAETFASQDVNIVLNYRNDEKSASKLVQELKQTNQNMVFSIQADVSRVADCQRLVDTIKEKGLRSVDILIHNAGPYINERKSMKDYSIEEWDYMINGNLSAVFYLTKFVLPMMRDQQWGRIITYGFDRIDTAPGWMYRSAFAAAKSGVASLTKTLSMEEAGNGVTVNMVCPGDIRGDWKEKRITEAISETDHETPIGRPGTGEDIARTIAFLCDPGSDFITGAIIPITGGKDVLGKIYRQSERSEKDLLN